MAGRAVELKLALAELFVEVIKANMLANDPYVVRGRSYPGLVESEIYQTIRAELDGDEVVIIIPEYFRNIETGRAANPNADRGQQPYPPPFSVILAWINRKGINVSGMTDNDLAYAIRYNIWVNGIIARPFLEPAIEEFFSGGRIDDLVLEFFNQELIDLISQALPNRI